MGLLSIVGTPIGNLEDITLRALNVLRACDAVLCEDTRVTKKLLAHYEISKPTLSYHAHSGVAKYDKILAHLAEGAHLALVSDAGTPTVSDPGAALVARVREEQPDTRIEVVPGPSAVSAALSVAGIVRDSFLFLGFLPHKKGRETLFRHIADSAEPVVLFESPHRLIKTLTSLAALLPPERMVVVCRELTKLHEEVVRGTAEEMLAYYQAHPDRVRGEIVLIVA